MDKTNENLQREMARLRKIEQAARAFDREFPAEHRIHPHSPAVLGLRAALTGDSPVSDLPGMWQPSDSAV
jgi:hypothetical protein